MTKEEFLASSKIPTTAEEVNWFEEAYGKAEYDPETIVKVNDMHASWMITYLRLCCFLRDQRRKGKAQFIISYIGDRKYLLHPIGNDKQVLEIKL